jgi:hypothetical protein
MMICKGKSSAYYPVRVKGSGLISGSRRIRYFRGFMLVSPKDCEAATGLRIKSGKH